MAWSEQKKKKDRQEEMRSENSRGPESSWPLAMVKI